MTTTPLSSHASSASPAGATSRWARFSNWFTQNAALQVLVCAALLALRKPWALHTPQFWAEDGEIFMKQDDASGIAAFLTSYNGYLHTLPRLIAWLARISADVAWWPAIYNWISFAITIGLFVRMASRRVELPAKPWLMLALVLVVGSGEVVLNATNLQWTTAFFLMLQLFTTRATTLGQRLGDVALMILVGLNGPFALVFLPLFAWRAWRDRNLDTFLLFGAVAAAALVQGLLVRGYPLNLENADAPFRPLKFLSLIGSRMVVWPLLGPGTARAWSPAVHAIVGVATLGPLLLWALRRDALRRVRAPAVFVLCFVVGAGLYRGRADVWPNDDLVGGDRYFHIPRVLLAWLVILEFHTRPRVIAWLARALVALALLSNARHFTLREPRDYRWAEHCDPIRRGEPANIYTLPEGWFIEYPGRPPRK